MINNDYDVKCHSSNNLLLFCTIHDDNCIAVKALVSPWDTLFNPPYSRADILDRGLY